MTNQDAAATHHETALGIAAVPSQTKRSGKTGRDGTAQYEAAIQGSAKRRNETWRHAAALLYRTAHGGKATPDPMAPDTAAKHDPAERRDVAFTAPGTAARLNEAQRHDQIRQNTAAEPHRTGLSGAAIQY